MEYLYSSSSETRNTTEMCEEYFNIVGTDTLKRCWLLLRSSTMNDDLDNVYRLLDTEQRPRTPDHTCPQSREIFEEHKQLAQEYLKVQTEIALLSQQKNALLKNLSIEDRKQKEELLGLEKEKESLRKLYQTFKHQLEMKKSGAQRTPAIAAIGPAVSGEDGWVVVSRQDPSRMS